MPPAWSTSSCVARGGGSLEDLAAFNSERVARAIAASQLPVVSAVGHETDFTIADFVADLRAPTPSAAAELITEAQHRIADHLARLNARLDRAAHFQLLQARQRLTRVPASRAESRVMTTLHRLEQRLDDANLRMEAQPELAASRTAVATWRNSAPASCGTIRASSWRTHDSTSAAGATRMEHAMRRTLHEQQTRLNSLRCPSALTFAACCSRSRICAGARRTRRAGSLDEAGAHGRHTHHAPERRRIHQPRRSRGAPTGSEGRRKA